MMSVATTSRRGTRHRGRPGLSVPGRIRGIQQLVNRTCVLFDPESFARGSAHIGECEEQLTELGLSVITSEADCLIYSVGPNSLANAPGLLWHWSDLGWRFRPAEKGLSGADRTLDIELRQGLIAARSARVIILSGDGRLADAATLAMARGSSVTVVGLKGDTSKSYARIGATVVELDSLESGWL